MCEGIPLFSNNKKAFHGVGTNSHSTAANNLKIKEDHYLKSEWHWWDKKFVVDHYDTHGKEILAANGVDIEKSTKIAEKYVEKHFRTQSQLIKWLKKTPSEWGRLMVSEHKSLTKKVNPKLVLYQSKIAKFKKEKIEKYNPYQATKLPALSKIPKELRNAVRNDVWNAVWNAVRNDVWNAVWNDVGNAVRNDVWNAVWNAVRNDVENAVRNDVENAVENAVRNDVENAVGNQVWATSYWAVKVVLGLPIKHWFFDFLKLGVMIVFVQGKVKVFGKKGKYLGEYDEKDWLNM